ncbi:hypothetical protein NM208_g405 [Fusarium decemcellulare]|uniref:Uncharacterized protein n=1 Tax=Fusarium decemcellulare TaxID=57161 RepID=A0ACC1SZS6_9HYPO|nr:hypothetical protein NM208_g405 [Fusarium decemcellulare]
MAPLDAASESKPTTDSALTLESWSQGFFMGALFIMIGMTLANMRKRVLLHKLILLELFLALPNTLFIFFDPPAWGWYLSSTAILLIASWTLHNVISWIKSKPFLKTTGRHVYIYTLCAAQLYWVVELYGNFAYFNGGHGRLFNMTRPFEPLFRDPWWIFTIANLLWNIKFRYTLTMRQIMRISPRFAILLLSMSLSVVFIVLEILAVTPALSIGGINPYWKFASVFKCFTDTVILDDFKTSLDRLSQARMNMLNNEPFGSNHSGVHDRWYSMNQRPRAASCSSERGVFASTEHIESTVTNANTVAIKVHGTSVMRGIGGSSSLLMSRGTESEAWVVSSDDSSLEEVEVDVNTEKLEIHVPEPFTSQRPALNYHHDSFDVSIDEHPLASTLPRATPDQPSVQVGPSAFRVLGVPPGTPVCLEDYTKSDKPQLTLHIVSFTDATLVSLCWPHIAVDAMSLRDISAAWSLALAGRESEIPPMLSADEDAMTRAGSDPAFQEPHVLQKQWIMGVWAFFWAFRFILDLVLWRKMETRTLYLPRKTVQELKSQALSSLSTHSSSTPFISDGDTVTAWLSVMATAAIFPQGSTRTISIGNAFDLRTRASSIFPTKPNEGVYIQNATFAYWTIFPAGHMAINRDKALGPVALAMRKALEEQTTEASIHTLAHLSRESLEFCGVTPLFGDTSSFMISMTNWTKARLFETPDFGPAIIVSSKQSSQGSSANREQSRSVTKGYPVYYHVQGVSPNNMLERNGAFIVGTPQGDYWINSCFPPEVWKLIEYTFQAAD